MENAKPEFAHRMENSPENAKPKLAHRMENSITFGLLLLMVLLLFLEIVLRLFNAGIPSSSDYIQHLVLWTTLLGAMITTREKKHLSLASEENSVKGAWGAVGRTIAAFVTITVVSTLFISSLSFTVAGFEFSDAVGIIPQQLVMSILPVGFLFMLIRFTGQVQGGLKHKLLASSGILLGIFFSFGTILQMGMSLVEKINPGNMALYENLDAAFGSYQEIMVPLVKIGYWPLFILIAGSAVFGTPIFIVLGGVGILLYSTSPDSMLINVPQEAYVILVKDYIAAIPLFTLAGYILSESRAGERFIKLFRALLGWLPGGVAIVAVVVCGFFTTFTGASGVTILALGSLLAASLLEQKYKENFTKGLLTGSGSIGLLFPPSLPLIMYAVAAQINVKMMFVAGVIPGLLMLGTLGVMSVVYAVKNKVERIPFQLKAISRPLLEAALEMFLPVIILVSFFSGFTTLTETGAIAVIYVLLVEVVIYRDIKLKDLQGVFIKAVPVLGGILIILSVAMALNSYIIDAEIPMKLSEWMRTYISSPLVFLLLLNVGLLITGCFMDIFSAILVVAPLVIALGKVYGINEIHLGIIFLANLQLGYLTPPVGLNLFVASYRFETPLTRIYKNVIPFFIALLVAVLLITYVPVLSTGLLNIIKV